MCGSGDNVPFVGLISRYNKTVKKSTRCRKEVYIMSKKIENAIVTAVGAVMVWGSGWLVLYVGEVLSKLIN